MNTRQRRLALPALGFTAALLFSACGPDGVTIDAASGGGLRAPTPIEVAGSGGSAETNVAESKIAGNASADSTMIAPAFIKFVLGDVGELPKRNTGSVFPAGATVSADKVATVARALGVTGTPTPAAADSGSSWQVGPMDGSAPSLTVSSDAQLSWWYSTAYADVVQSSEGCVEPASEDGVSRESGDCVDPTPPTPPTGVPTAAEAEARVRDILVAIGENGSALTLSPSADEWYAQVSVTQKLDGNESPVRWDFGFGAEGVLQYANGSFARPQAVGPYPLVDLDTAFKRLEDQNSGWFGYGPGGVADAGVARSATEESGESDVPVEPGEPLEVTLTGVEADVWWAWDTEGSLWLIPAYAFTDEDGGHYTVPAVTDEFLIVNESVEVQPAEIDPEEAGTAVISPELNDAVGTTLAEFTKRAEGLGFTVRVVELDGESLPVTADFSTTRINVAVKGDVVTAISDIG